nr:quinone oxidoreductase [Streptomyces antimycoticus]
MAVDTAACGVNYIDIYQRRGLYPLPLPFVPGQEGAGVVTAVGAGVRDVRPGDRVAWADAQGSYAERTVLDADRTVPVPAGLSFDAAAGVALQGMTAHYLAHDAHRISDGHTVLVHAAAGGVGLLLVQLAKLRGAHVIGTVSTELKERAARAAGADHIVRYGTEDFAARARELTGGTGVDAVYDGVGRATFDQSLECLRPRGCLVLYGQSSGPVPPVDPQRLNAAGSVFLTRPSLTHYLADRRELLARAADVFGWLESGRVTLSIDKVFTLAGARRAHVALESRRTSGKILLRP